MLLRGYCLLARAFCLLAEDRFLSSFMSRGAGLRPSVMELMQK